MKAEIINIGDELLIGQVTNTNASWMGEQLNLAGISVSRFTVIADLRGDILEALAEAEARAEIVLISGGIGPTNDDITRAALCEYFNTEMVFCEEAFRDIEALFASRNYLMTELNRLQAMVPAACTSIPNRNGTARGMWFEKQRPGGGTTVFVSMPGVPFEMKAMMEGEIIPRLVRMFDPPVICHRTLLTQGIGESFLAARIEPWENALPPHLKLAYLPQPGIVRLRLTGSGPDGTILRTEVDTQLDKLRALIPEYFFGFDGDTLESVTGQLLLDLGATLSTAESCTGGAIARMITSIAGSSRYFKGSVVAYDNAVKSGILGIDPGLIEKHGAVSREVVTEMALAVRTRLATDYAIATSGVAGPTGGTAEKPVGTAWIAIASPAGVEASRYLFGDDRERNIRRTSLQALSLLRKTLLG